MKFLACDKGQGVSQPGGKRTGSMLAVEFPSPCDRSEFAFPPLCLQKGWDREGSTPLKERNLYRQTLRKGLGTLYRLRLESPNGGNTSPHW
jgi:hypothetical protein